MEAQGNMKRITGPARKVTAVGTIGPIGQSFTVFEKNWVCIQCKGENLARRQRCHRCKAVKPDEGGGFVIDDAFKQALEGGNVSTWREAIDPASHLVYYYNMETSETSWERPKCLGAAPHATGWFGRGAANLNPNAFDVSVYVDRNTRWLKRPAKKQKDHIEDNRRSVLEGAYEYNIWYDKYMGDHWSNSKGKELAESRCFTEEFAGYTKADIIDTKSKFFCIHFARGICARGSECSWFHRTPVLSDEACNDQAKDIFGRERHKDHRDDMGGVGSISSPSRTLYVGGLKKNAYKSPEDLEKCIWHQFGEWGEVESVNVVYRLSVAFVRYRMRSNCEFAKEAMSNQSLLAEEILNIRWAHDDPNPVAKEAVARSDLDAAVAILQSRGILPVPDKDDADGTRMCQMDTPANYCLPPSKKTKIGDFAEGTEMYGTDMPPELRYPDTDAQYSGGGIFRQYRPPWRQYQDPSSATFYYYNELTQETQWEKPDTWGNEIKLTTEDQPTSENQLTTESQSATENQSTTEDQSIVENQSTAVNQPTTVLQSRIEENSSEYQQVNSDADACGAYKIGDGSYSYNVNGYVAEIIQ